MGVLEGPDCTGSTVTACWRGLCGTVGIETPAGASRENLHRETIAGNGAGKAFPSLFNGRRGKKSEAHACGKA